MKQKVSDIIDYSAISISEANEIMRFSNTIIDNLDDEALLQLTTGTEKDIYGLITNIYNDTYNVLSHPELGHSIVSTKSLERLSVNVEETLRRDRFDYFILSTLPNFILAPLHLEWCDFVRSYKYLNIIAARNLGKSFWASKAYPLWKMYKYEKPKPLERIRKSVDLCHKGMLFTHETGLGEDLMTDIKDEIENNEILRARLFPKNSSSEGWAQRRITCKNGAKLQIKSYGSKARGRHPGYIIVDDFLSENVLYSKDQNEKIINYFHSVIMNMILQGGQVLVIGTPFSQFDLYADLKTKKGWKVFEYPAIFPDGTLTWAERYSFQALLEKKETQGSLVFSREILCKPITNDSTIFPYEILRKCFVNDATIVYSRSNFKTTKIVRTVLGCDFSISANVGADWFVFTTLGIDEFDQFWILNIHRDQGKTFGEQMAKIRALHANFHYDVIFFEDNNFQQIYVQEAEKLNLPVIGDKTTTNKYSFESGLPAMAVLFEHGKIKIPRGNEESIHITDVLVSELSSIAYTSNGLKGVGEHDDTGMSLWKAIRAAQYKTDLSLNFL